MSLPDIKTLMFYPDFNKGENLSFQIDEKIRRKCLFTLKVGWKGLASAKSLHNQQIQTCTVSLGLEAHAYKLTALHYMMKSWPTTLSHRYPGH